jgi:arginine/lysine/ornithine decarboxylase
MDRSRAPVLEALQGFRRRGDVVYGPPGHEHGRGADPPGVPVPAPGERISQDAVDHLATGVRAGMLVPDAADPSMETLRVVA